MAAPPLLVMPEGAACFNQARVPIKALNTVC